MIRFLKFRKPAKKTSWKKKILFFLLSVVCCLLLAGFLGYLLIIPSAREVIASAQKLPTHTEPLKDALLLQDLPAAKAELEAIDRNISEIEEKLAPLSWMRSIPFAKDYFSDTEHLLRAGHYGIRAGQKSIEAVVPVAGILGFKTEETEAIQMSSEDRIAGAVRAMPQIAQGLDSVDPDLLAVKNEIASIDPARYPKSLSFGGYQVHDLFTQARSYTDQVDLVLPRVKKSLIILPKILGEASSKTYIIIFQNDKEIRPTGGFWTAYALAKVREGKLTDLSSEDMYFVDYRIAEKSPAPAVYQRFLKVDHWFIRDANLSPDYKISALKFLDFWRQAGSAPVDGVLALDTFFVRDLLELLGPIEVNGYSQPFTHENVVLELEKQATVVKKEQAGRKALVGQLMDKMLEKALGAPKQSWDDLLSLLLKLSDEKHLVFYFVDEGAQAWAEELNWAGRVKDFEGDYLEVNEANFAGAKANLYVTRKVTKVVEMGKDSKLLSTVTVDFENPEPYDGWLNGPYRSYIRLLAPEGSELISIGEGKESVPQESYFDSELGKQVFAAFNITKPQNASRLVFKYQLPGSVVQDGKYRLLIQKQPGHDAPEYEIKLGKKTEKFKLNKDREVEISIK